MEFTEKIFSEINQLTLLLELSNSGVAVIRGPHLTFDSHNSKFVDLFAGENFTGRGWNEFRGDNLILPSESELVEIMSAGESLILKEVEIRSSVPDPANDLKYYDFEFSLINPESYANCFGIYLQCQDQTERHQIREKIARYEEQLFAIDERLSTAIAVSGVGFYDWNISENTMVFSDQMRADWGFGPDEELVDLSLRIHAEDRERVLGLIRAAVDGHADYSTEYRVVKPAGEVAWIRAQGKVFYDKKNKPFRFFGTSVNITAQKKLELELEKSKRAADHANEQKSFVLACVSHEIRNPLSSIIGFSEMVRDQALDEPNRRELLDKIVSNATNLKTLLDDILDLSKAEAGRLKTEKISFDLEELMTQVLGLFTEALRKKELSLSVTLPKNAPPKLISDPTRLRQILINLVSNAVKFTSHGSISINVEGNFHAPPNGQLRFRISDTGEGLTEEQRALLFEPFQQATTAVSRMHGGTGLGLAISKRFAKALGGDIGVEQSAPGQGSTFWFTIACEVEENLQPRPETKFEPSMCDLSRVKIMVADDSTEGRFLLCHLLRQRGATVLEANDGEEACERVLADQFDMVLMDVEMPNMDGLQAAKILRERGFQKPIIAITGHDGASDISKAQAAGYSGHLVKPIVPKELLGLISRALCGEPPSVPSPN